MTARVQRLMSLALLVFVWAWLLIFLPKGQWLLAIYGVVAIALLQPVVLGVEFFVLLPLVARFHGLMPPHAVQLVCAWWQEVRAAFTVFHWWQPFRADSEPDQLGPQFHGRRAVLLVHGLFGNRGFWNPWLRQLRKMGVPFTAINLEPMFASIEAYVPAIDAAIARAQQATGMPPLVVAHSMGGLAVRAWLRSRVRDGEEGGRRVAGVITIGTPHGGTFTARFSPAENAKQMRLGSAWLGALASGEGLEPRARFTCYYSDCDNISMPSSTATLPEADNRLLAGYPHIALAFAPQILEEVLRRVRRVGPAEATCD